MRGSRLAILAALVAVAVAVALVLAIGEGGGRSNAATGAPVPGLPDIAFISPRNGAVQRGLAVVAKVEVENFLLAPRHFGGEPLLGEGNIRFSLHRVPDCVDPVKLQRAIESPIGNERLQGASFDYPKYAGSNGVLGARIGASGSYSPATRPEIFYTELRPGFYRLIATLAANDGSPTAYHAVTNFQILERPNHPLPACTGGKVSSAKAATSFE
ncbi:MAG: hypothetical protein ACHQCF_04675 [Solirubrobacterales bacterium]